MAHVPNRLSDAERLVFFSDAVFAIAMTLLVLDLKLPPMPEGVTRQQVQDLLVAKIPAFIAFVISFVVIATLWMTHHRRFERVTRVDAGTIQLDLVLLFFVALLPMPTSLLLEPTSGSPWPVVIYAATAAGAYLSLNLLWWHLHRRGLSGVDDRWYGFTQLVTLPVGLVFLLSIPIAFVSPRWANLGWMLIAPAQMLTRRLAVRRHGDVEAEHDGAGPVGPAPSRA